MVQYFGVTWFGVSGDLLNLSPGGSPVEMTIHWNYNNFRNFYFQRIKFNKYHSAEKHENQLPTENQEH